MRKKLWYLKQMEVFSAVPEKELKSIGKLMREKEVSKRTLLFQPGDKEKIYIIKKGQVTLYHLTKDGRKITVDTLGPGSIFGTGFGLEKGANFAEATADTFLCITSTAALAEIAQQQGGLAQKLLEFLLRNISRANEKVVTMALPNPRERFKRLLIQLGELYGLQLDDCWIKITEKFTEEQLAEMMGTSRVTVSKVINEFKREGILKRKKKIISFHSERCSDIK